tara:strand:+ start:4926 stop:5480 length:555 start_codon:yes stop_codon:yes gene_type:complete
MKLLIEDDFFESPDNIRDIALSTEYTCSEDVVFDVGWRGNRTEGLDTFNNKILNDISEKVFNIVTDFFEIDKSYYAIKTYFHFSHLGTKDTLDDFDNKKYHIDPTAEYAGIVYLNPNPPNNTGTSILDGTNNKIISVENVYNRLIAYPSNHIHAPSNLFGTDKNTGRLTFTYFIDKNWSWESKS